MISMLLFRGAGVDRQHGSPFQRPQRGIRLPDAGSAISECSQAPQGSRSQKHNGESEEKDIHVDVDVHVDVD